MAPWCVSSTLNPRLAVNSRLHPGWCHRVLVCRAWLVPGTHCTSGVTSEDSHASAVIVGLHQPHASVNWRSALASAVQGLSHPSRTQCVRLAEARLSGPRLLQRCFSLKGHRLIVSSLCDSLLIGWFGELVSPIGHLSSSVVSWLKD